MSILSDTMRMGASQPSADTAYQIEKSLRFDDGDTPYLLRQVSSNGNTRTWTWSGWIKRGNIVAGGIFSSATGGHPSVFLKIDNVAGQFEFANYNGSYLCQLKTTQVLRDPSAWFHIVVAVDTTHATAASRNRIYVNGKEITAWATQTNFSQYVETQMSKSDDPFRIGDHDGSYFDGYLSDVQFIDGLQLSPASFGEFDSARNWNPAEFKLLGRNNGSTWSGMVTGTEDPGWEKTQVFNGNSANSGRAETGNTLTFTPTTKMERVASLRVFADHRYGSQSASTLLVNGTNYSHLVPKTSGAWVDIPETTLETIAWNSVLAASGSSGDAIDIGAIEVDGEILVDGEVGYPNGTTRNNPNNGTTWSDHVSGSAYSGSYPASLAFNGTIGGDPAIAASTQTFSPPGGITVNDSLRIYQIKNGSGNTFTVNGTDYSGSTTEPGSWLTIPNVTTLTSVVWGTSGYNMERVSAIEVDGHILIDSSVDNSYHLKFNDTSSNAAIGYDSLKTFSDSSFKAINGAPILKTNHDGSAVTSGYRTDDNATNLLLALPLNDLNDVHGSIQGNASNNISMTNDGVASETSTTKYYGTCQDWASGDRLYTASDSSLAWGTGNFTIEGWFNWDNNYSGSWGSNRKYLFDNQTASTSDFEYVRMFADGGTDSAGDGTILKTMNASGSDVTVQELNKNQWYHIAMVRSGSTMKIYVDGVEKVSQTYANDVTSTIFTVGAYHDDSGGWWSGKIQDFKIYNTAVYTAGFSPVKAPNDFTVTNLAEGLDAPTYSSGLTGSSGSGLTNPASYAFNGLADNNMAYDGNGGNATLSWTNPAGSGVTALGSGLRIFPRATNGGSRTFTLNGADTTTLAANGWTTISVGSQTHLNSFTITGGEAYLSAVEVNGAILVDGSDSDASNDSPTNYEDTSGNVHGNFCTANPLQSSSSVTFSQGNLELDGEAGGWYGCGSTMAVQTGLWYWEATAKKDSSGDLNAISIGITDETFTSSINVGYSAGSYGYSQANGNKQNNSSQTSYGTAAVENDVISVAFDATNGKLWFGKNGTWFASGNPATGANAAFTSIPSKLYTPMFSFDRGKWIVNFGQRSFKYTVPTGYKALCTQNLDDFSSDDSLNAPNYFFDINTYTGTGTGVSNPIKGMKFGPDLIWGKATSYGDEHGLQATVIGTGKTLNTTSTSAETTNSGYYVTAFNSDGYTLGNGANLNGSSTTYVNWCWDAGASAATPSTAGTKTPTAQWFNTTAGFTMGTYDGNLTNCTIGTGLSAPVEFIIVKRHDGSDGWIVYPPKGDDGKTKYLRLNEDSAVASGTSGQTNYWNSTAPTNTVFTIGSGGHINGNGSSNLFLAWTSIPGFSKFGMVTGNGSTDGPFVHLGFKPKLILWKGYDQQSSWGLIDTARSPYNVADDLIVAEANSAQDSGNSNWARDILSNGFKIRGSHSAVNGSSNEFLYAAWAEHPFKTSRAH